MENLPDQFAERLGRALRDRKLANRWLANKVGKSEAWISGLLRGNRRTPLEVYGKIADALDIPFVDFFGPHQPVIPEHILSDRELDLLRAYRAMPTDKRREADDFVAFQTRRRKPDKQRSERRPGRAHKRAV